ncbi:hypothetical protein CON65_16175 [Bacillus pseudomycoides]|uniref:Uncharacterized protein n=1 Tax=Bacillus pseudomycoides TaxID=64104 RepID=A0AA91ZSC9_9BACI|nr:MULTISPECIES: hypothetical protein [Bacillus]PEB48542.1 hypothetical protein COO03_24380 [Bacillus sp. AFS098217]PED81610.1 hypothetical protein CON65_16175 [Bacillus pseudomycoides]PEU07663.1 hypothetical protein CN524_19910 [Bacillus sp. AFS019443]PEU16972.1 hypothetical protein CN525_15425 [Bacillus sp. AFS014408]PFW61410.1 hypothetical protein COL20_17560 [Bacillus sp. AFS075034]
MNENPFDKEYRLSQHLDSDHVEIPDFPQKVNMGDRFLRFLASPAKDPVAATIGNDLSIAFHVSLLAGVPVLSVIMILIASL